MFEDRKLFSIARWAVVGKLICMILGIGLVMTLGQAPSDPVKYFELSIQHPWFAFLVDDAYNVVLVFLYIPSMIGVYYAIKDNKPILSLYSVIFLILGVVFMLSSHTGMTMMNLAKSYKNASDPEILDQYITAGRTVMASNIWKSSAGFFSGILLQGGSVMICLAMIGSGSFTRWTIISGIVSNSFDLVNHLLHYDLPELSQVILMIAGPFYLMWFIMLIVDLGKLAKERKSTT